MRYQINFERSNFRKAQACSALQYLIDIITDHDSSGIIIQEALNTLVSNGIILWDQVEGVRGGENNG